MTTSYPRLLSSCLLLLISLLAMSCSAEPTVATTNEPAPAQNIVIADEDEVLSWEESAEKSKKTPAETDSK